MFHALRNHEGEVVVVVVVVAVYTGLRRLLLGFSLYIHFGKGGGGR